MPPGRFILKGEAVTQMFTRAQVELKFETQVVRDCQARSSPGSLGHLLQSHRERRVCACARQCAHVHAGVRVYVYVRVRICLCVCARAPSEGGLL